MWERKRREKGRREVPGTSNVLFHDEDAGYTNVFSFL